MSTSAQVALISRQDLEKLSREHVELKTGERLKGEVVNLRQDGKTTIDFGKFQADVELDVPVQKGDIVEVVVAEKGKQIKLKLEHVRSRIAVEAQKAVKQAESMPARDAREIQQQTENIVRDEIQTPTDRSELFKSSENLPKELKDALTKLQKILQNSETANVKDIKNLAGEIKNILSTLKSYSDAMDVEKTIVKPAAQLDSIVRNSDIPIDKEIREILTKIIETAERIGRLKNIEQLPEIKTLIDKDLKPALDQLKEIVVREAPAPQSTGRQPVDDVGKAVDKLLKSVENALDKLPDKVVLEAAKTPEQQPREVRQILEQVISLKKMADNSPVPLDKETVDTINRLAETAQKLSRPETPEQSIEIKNIIREQIKPDILRLQRSIENEVIRAEPRQQPPARELKAAVDQLLQAVDKALETLPEKIESSTAKLQPSEIADIAKQVVRLKTLAEQSQIPLDRETAAAIDRLSEAAAKLSQTSAPEQLPELRTLVENTIKPDLQQLKQTIDREVLRAEPIQREPVRQVKQSVDETLRNLEQILEKLPDKIRASERIETLLKEIKSIRQALEPRGENIENAGRIADRVSGLRSLVEAAGLPNEKELDIIVKQLSDAAEQISRLKSPEQLPELKTIIDTQLRPNLSALGEWVGRETRAPEFESISTSENRQTVEELKQQVETLQREVEITLEKLPDRGESTVEARELLKHIDGALQKISTFTYAPGNQQFAEDVENLFENIKMALKQLKVNVQSGKPLFDLPPDVKNIFDNLQVNFNAADMEQAVTQQVNQLHTLVETLENSGFAADKRVELMMGKLSQLIGRLGELQKNGQWQEIAQLVRREIGPNLKLLKQLFTPGENVKDPIIRERMETVGRAVDSAEQHMETLLEKAAPRPAFPDFLEKAEQAPKAVKTIFEKLPESLRTPENFNRLSENIQQALARTAGEPSSAAHAAAESSPFPPEVRQMLSSLRSHFEPLDIGQGAVKLAPKLKKLVDDSGVFFEKKIGDAVTKLTEAAARMGSIENLGQMPEIRDIIANDIKPSLQQLQQFFNSDRFTSEPGQEELLDVVKKAVEELLTNINSQQSRAVDGQSQQQPVMAFTFNLPIKGEEDAQLKVFYNRGRQKDENQEFKLSLLLEMDKLGQVRTDFAHWEKNLSITFYVRDHDIKEHVEAHLEEVQEPLSGEYDALNFNVLVSRDGIADFGAEPATPEIISDKAVDVKV